MSEVLLSTGDATVGSYTVNFDKLAIEITLWNETVRRISASGVTHVEDTGTWECDAIVRLPDLDSPKASATPSSIQKEKRR